jgi:hypothetical protein
MRSVNDHYIALHAADLVRMLGDEPSVTIFEREHFQRLCLLLQATIHHEYHSRLCKLKEDYAPFDPDDDGPGRGSLTDEERADRCSEMFADFDSLLVRANYRRLSREEIEGAIRSPSNTGLRLRFNLDLFDRLEVYVRGSCELPRPIVAGRLRLPLFADGTRNVPTTIPGYRRMALIFRLRKRSLLTDPLDTRAIVLKLFKDIPQDDVETLLPGASVTIGPFEQAQIVVPTLSGIALTFFKLLKGAALVAFAGIYGLLAFLGLVSGVIGYGIRSFYSYLRTREKHQLCLTRHLYFQNLDNNAGVIYHLLAEAEEQDFREAILAWWLLWRGGMNDATPEQIDAAAEQWLARRGGLKADFEIGDALEKLQRLQIAHESAGRWRAVAIEEALAALDRAWDEQFNYQQRSPRARHRAQPQGFAHG